MSRRHSHSAPFLFQLLDSLFPQGENKPDNQRALSWKEIALMAAVIVIVAGLLAITIGTFSGGYC